MTPTDATTPDGLTPTGLPSPVDAAQPSAETRPLTLPPADESADLAASDPPAATEAAGPADSGARMTSGAYPKRTLGLHASAAHPRPTSSLPRATGIPQPTTGARRTGPPARTTRRLPALEPEPPTAGAPTAGAPAEAIEAAPPSASSPTSAPAAPPTATNAREPLPATAAIEASTPHVDEDETPTLPRLPRVAPPIAGSLTNARTTAGPPTAGPPTAGPPTAGPPPAAETEEAMARVTQAMRALTAVHDEATLATQHTHRLQPRAPAADSRPLTIVAGSGKALRIPVSPGLAAKHPRARRTLTSAVMLLTSLGMVLGMLYTLHPAGIHQAAAAPLELVAAQFQQANQRSADQRPGSAWGTEAGAMGLGIGGGAGPGVKAPGSAGIAVKKTTTPPPGPPPQGIGVSPAPFAPWPPQNPWMQVPGRGAFAAQPVAGYYSAAFGQCTWWAQYQRRDENLGQLGDARYWAGAARARGMHVSDRPAPGATVVFQPGVQGAGGGGHVAHVIAVYPGGWFLISEMNFYWNGGGWGRVDYRYAHSGWGVSFIY